MLLYHPCWPPAAWQVCTLGTRSHAPVGWLGNRVQVSKHCPKAPGSFFGLRPKRETTVDNRSARLLNLVRQRHLKIVEKTKIGAVQLHSSIVSCRIGTVLRNHRAPSVPEPIPTTLVKLTRPRKTLPLLRGPNVSNVYQPHSSYRAHQLCHQYDKRSHYHDRSFAVTVIVVPLTRPSERPEITRERTQRETRSRNEQYVTHTHRGARLGFGSSRTG